uniref:Uncharacterized protein n=1 Tax=Peronospora matthiolae TaxID=2874970 RepID=A0AAV1T7H8_9STRA
MIRKLLLRLRGRKKLRLDLLLFRRRRRGGGSRVPSVPL